MPVAKLARNLHVAGDAGQPLEPVAGHHAREVARPTGDDLHSRDPVEDRIGLRTEGGLQHRPGSEAAFEGTGDRLRLFEDLLLHVMPVGSTLHRFGGNLAHHYRARHAPLPRTPVTDTRSRQSSATSPSSRWMKCRVTGIESGDVGGEEVLARSDTDRERTPETGRDHPVGVVLADDPDREGAAQLLRRGAHRIREVQSSTHLAVYQIGDDLGVGIGDEVVAVPGEIAPQRCHGSR